MIKWTRSTMAQRNAIDVRFADVIAGAEVLVESTGSIFRAIKPGTGAGVWAGVVQAQSTWEPEPSTLDGDLTFGTAYGRYTRIGDSVEFKAAFIGVAHATAPSDVYFEFAFPIAGNTLGELSGAESRFGPASVMKDAGGTTGGGGYVGAGVGFEAAIWTHISSADDHDILCAGTYPILEPA
jgi:hypothetical protein